MLSRNADQLVAEWRDTRRRVSSAASRYAVKAGSSAGAGVPVAATLPRVAHAKVNTVSSSNSRLRNRPSGDRHSIAACMNRRSILTMFTMPCAGQSYRPTARLADAVRAVARPYPALGFVFIISSPSPDHTVPRNLGDDPGPTPFPTRTSRDRTNTSHEPHGARNGSLA